MLVKGAPGNQKKARRLEKKTKQRNQNKTRHNKNLCIFYEMRCIFVSPTHRWMTKCHYATSHNVSYSFLSAGLNIHAFLWTADYYALCAAHFCYFITTKGTKLYIKSLRAEQNGRHFADDNFNDFSKQETVLFWFKFHWNLFIWLLLTICHHWFRWWLDTEEA